MDLRREFIKIVAIVTMVIDHIGWLILPSWPILRIIGRIAMPCYAYLIGCGLKSTHSRKMYFWRLLGLATISQFGFVQFSPDKFNIIFTFALSVAVITAWQDGKVIKSLLLMAVLAIAPVEFGLYGLLSIVILQKVHTRPIITGLAYLIVSVICGMVYKLSALQAFAVFGVVVIYFAPYWCIWQRPQQVWRFFYPVHWWLFVLWRYLCTGF